MQHVLVLRDLGLYQQLGRCFGQIIQACPGALVGIQGTAQYLLLSGQWQAVGGDQLFMGGACTLELVTSQIIQRLNQFPLVHRGLTRQAQFTKEMIEFISGAVAL